MSAAAEGPDRLSLVVFSGAFDKVHYALAMAAAALAGNRGATLFFTMEACRALAAGTPERPGWQDLRPTEAGLSPEEAEARFVARGIGGFEELLAAVVALGGKVMICEMGLRALGLEDQPLRSDLAVEPGGLITFLAGASKTGAMVFV